MARGGEGSRKRKQPQANAPQQRKRRARRDRRTDFFEATDSDAEEDKYQYKFDVSGLLAFGRRAV